MDEPRRARLVRRRLGRDDGRDDVPVGRADGRALLADDAAALAGSRRWCSRPAISLTWALAGLARLRARGRRGELPAASSHWDRAGRWVAGGTLVVAAVYELTPLKDDCLGKCRSPLGFLLGSWRGGVRGAL